MTEIHFTEIHYNRDQIIALAKIYRANSGTISKALAVALKLELWDDPVFIVELLEQIGDIAKGDRGGWTDPDVEMWVLEGLRYA